MHIVMYIIYNLSVFYDLIKIKTIQCQHERRIQLPKLKDSTKLYDYIVSQDEKKQRSHVRH